MTCKQKGGGCGCHKGGDVPNWLQRSMDTTEVAVKGQEALSSTVGQYFKGGYRATARDKYYLRKYKRGESIGFTMKASLKSKGLIPRSSKTLKGKKVVGSKYKH